MKPRERNNKRRRKHRKDKNTKKTNRCWSQDIEMKEIVIIFDRDEGGWRFVMVV